MTKQLTVSIIQTKGLVSHLKSDFRFREHSSTIITDLYIKVAVSKIEISSPDLVLHITIFHQLLSSIVLETGCSVTSLSDLRSFTAVLKRKFCEGRIKIHKERLDLVQAPPCRI